MANNTTASILVSQPFIDWITVLIIVIIGAIIGIIIYRWGPEYMKQEPRKRPNMLNFILTLVLIIAILIVTLTNNFNTEVATLLGAIAGYIFGVTTDPRLLKPTGIDGMPIANIKIIKSSGIAGDPISLDGSDSVDPASSQLTYSWKIIKEPEESKIKLDPSNNANLSFTPEKAGTYEIQLTVNNKLQDSDATSVILEVTGGETPSA